jgi:hypothetical protein
VGGTSAGSPQWAGLFALANQGRASAGLSSLGTGVAAGTNVRLYQLAGGTSYTNPKGDFVDITSGSNGYSAAVGYDFATGLGSPVANKLIPDLINAPLTQPPTLAPIANQTMAPYPATLAVTLNGSDTTGYALTYSASAQSLPYVLNQSYQFYQDTGGYYQNYRGQQEKYLRAKVSASNYSNGGGDFWYYILPNGDLYEFTPPYSNSALSGNLVAHLGVSVYNDPSLLYNAQNTAVPVGLTVSGNQLTIAPSSGYAGAFLATATVSDGHGGTASQSFQVLVTAPSPPTLAAIADQTVGVYPATLAVSLNGSDPNGYALTYSATAQSLPYALNQSYHFYEDAGGYYQNYRGQQRSTSAPRSRPPVTTTAGATPGTTSCPTATSTSSPRATPTMPWWARSWPAWARRSTTTRRRSSTRRTRCSRCHIR